MVYSYEYTTDGKLHSFTDNINGRVTVYKYDTNDRLVGMVEYESGDMYHDYSYDLYYNDKSQLSSVYYDINFINGTETDSTAHWYSYAYNGDGSLKYLRTRTTPSDGNETYITE